MRLLCWLRRRRGAGGHMWTTDEDSRPFCLTCKKQLWPQPKDKT